MAGIPKAFIQSVLERSDIIEQIGQRIELKKAGPRYKARCPFHNEKTPSFSVNPDRQFFYCFGCGASGDILEFIMRYDHLDFIDALSLLANHLGLEIPRDGEQEGAKNNLAPLYECTQKASQHFQQRLKQSKAAIHYLKARGLSGQIAKQYAIGYARESWDDLQKHLHHSHVNDSIQHACGLLIQKERGGYYDRFRHRITFPIRDPRGRTIGFGGRSLEKDQQPKYLNSPETEIFHKNQALYGLYEALQVTKNPEKMVVVEGYMDVIALAQYGIPYAVATLGTATNSKHVQLLFRYTHQVVFCFDGDNAGRQAAYKALQANLPLLRDGVSIAFVFLPDGEDPDSFVRQQGQAAFEQLIDQAIDSATFLFEQLDLAYPIHSLADKSRYAKAANDLINTMPEGLYRNLLHKALAKRLSIDTDDVQQLSKTPPAEAETTTTQPSNLRITSHPLRYATALLLQHPELHQEALSFVETMPQESGEEKVFIKLVYNLNQTPDLPTSHLIELFENEKIRNHLAQLSVWQAPIPDSGSKAEFCGLIQHLKRNEQERQLEALIARARQHSLSDDEKKRLQQLLTLTKTPLTPNE